MKARDALSVGLKAQMGQAWAASQVWGLCHSGAKAPKIRLLGFLGPSGP